MIDCIKYPGSLNRDGYGDTSYLGERALSHRAAYAKAHGLRMSDLKGIIIRHTCDNPACINPEHLIPGTHADNMNDMKVRGRAAKYEQNGRSKLTLRDVEFIRANAIPKDKDFGFTAIAKRLNVTTNTVWAAFHNISWK
jgi:hypothetical protein